MAVKLQRFSSFQTFLGALSKKVVRAQKNHEKIKMPNKIK
jgi:hypothetical protein